MIHMHIMMTNSLIKTEKNCVASMKDNGIGTIVDVGSNMETSTWIVEAVTRYPMMYGAVGVHPSDTAELKESNIDTLKKYAAMDRILAIGEIGLDYYWG